MRHLNPAQYVIKIFGGVKATARAVGRTPGAIIFWKHPKSKGGRGGNVPTIAQRIILKIALRDGLDITPQDLAYGRTVTTVAE